MLTFQPRCADCPITLITGGGERDRTDDLLRAKQVLSQLSYTPQKTYGFTISQWPLAISHW
jgi:hypothetical protein